MRIANLILAHKNPEQLLALINQYPPDLFHNWIHIDAQSDLKEFKKIINHPNVSIIRPRKVVWAGYSLVWVTIEGLNDIIKSKEKFIYINLMSGLDLPIKSTVSFHKFLSNSYVSTNAEFFHILELDNWDAKHRYEQYHLSDWTIRGRYTVEKLINKMIGKRKFYNGKMKPYGHSQWFTATHDFIKYSLNFFKTNPDYLNFLKTMWGPDEFVFNSLLMKSPMSMNISDKSNLRYIDWTEAKASPKVLKMDDFEKISFSECYIARKFDSQIDNQIIDKILGDSSTTF